MGHITLLLDRFWLSQTGSRWYGILWFCTMTDCIYSGVELALYHLLFENDTHSTVRMVPSINILKIFGTNLLKIPDSIGLDSPFVNFLVESVASQPGPVTEKAANYANL